MKRGVTIGQRAINQGEGQYLLTLGLGLFSNSRGDIRAIRFIPRLNLKSEAKRHKIGYQWLPPKFIRRPHTLDAGFFEPALEVGLAEALEVGLAEALDEGLPAAFDAGLATAFVCK